MRIRGWTEHDTLGLILASLSAALASLAALDAPAPRSAMIVAVILTVAVGLRTGSLGGLGAGIAAAAGYVEIKRRLGLWDTGEFTVVALGSLGLLVLGWCAGLAGSSWRRTLAGLSRSAPATVVATPGPLGLLSLDLGTARLVEELHRAGRFGGLVEVVVIGVHRDPQAAEPADRASAVRGIARLLVASLGPQDVPFALDEHTMAAILPDASSAQAWSVAGQLLDAAEQTTYADRDRGQRRATLSGHRVQVSVVEGTATMSAEQVLDGARRAVRAG